MMTATNGLGEPITPPSLYTKLAEVMGEVGYVKKNGYNSFHKYHYVTEADLVDAVRSKLAARNVVVIPSLSGIDERPIKTSGGKASTITTARIAFTFCDGDSGQTHTAEWAGCGEDAADKGLYSAMTGAEKYFLMKAFMIATGDDPEADHKDTTRSQRPQQAESVSDVPATTEAPVPIGDAAAAEIILNSDVAGIPRDDLRKAAWHAAGQPADDTFYEGSFELDQYAIDRLAEFYEGQRTRMNTWMDKRRAKMAEEAKGATA
jgi:hypothetical protein